MVTTSTRGARLEGKILAIVMVVCALVLGAFGWAVVLMGGWTGWLLIVAAACAACIARCEWNWA